MGFRLVSLPDRLSQRGVSTAQKQGNVVNSVAPLASPGARRRIGIPQDGEDE
jgi:hypothetical protein